MCLQTKLGPRINNGLPRWNGAEVAVDATLVSALTSRAEPCRAAGWTAGAALLASPQLKNAPAAVPPITGETARARPRLPPGPHAPLLLRFAGQLSSPSLRQEPSLPVCSPCTFPAPPRSTERLPCSATSSPIPPRPPQSPTACPDHHTRAAVAPLQTARHFHITTSGRMRQGHFGDHAVSSEWMSVACRSGHVYIYSHPAAGTRKRGNHS